MRVGISVGLFGSVGARVSRRGRAWPLALSEHFLYLISKSYSARRILQLVRLSDGLVTFLSYSRGFRSVKSVNFS